METSLFAFDERASAIDNIHAQTAIYTSSCVVEMMLDRIGWPNDGGRLLDPACGDGSFVLCAMARLKLNPDKEDQLNRIRGYEIHPGAVVDARERVASYLVECGWSSSRAEHCAREIIIEADFLTDRIDETFDFIAGNPPYLRLNYVPAYFQAIYKDRLPIYTHGDLLHAFLDACVKLKPVAVTFVTADRWLFNETAGELRTRLGELVGIDYVARLDCETSFYRPKRRIKDSLPRVHPVEVVLRPRESAARPLTYAPVQIDSDLSQATSTQVLGDIADLSLAPWLGTDGVWAIDKATASKLDPTSLIPIVDVKDIVPGTDTIVSNRRMGILTTREMEPTGSIREHLLKNRYKLPPRCLRDSCWWMPTERLKLSMLNKPMVMIPKISQRIRAIPVPAGCLPYNHNHVLIPKGDLCLEDLIDILTCENSQNWFRANAVPIENGFFQLCTRVFRNMPV